MDGTYSLVDDNYDFPLEAHAGARNKAPCSESLCSDRQSGRLLRGDTAVDPRAWQFAAEVLEVAAS